MTAAGVLNVVTTPILTCSALEGRGLEEIWQGVQDHRRALQASGELDERRRAQRLRSMRTAVEAEIIDKFWGRAGTIAELLALEAQVLDGSLSPDVAAE